MFFHHLKYALLSTLKKKDTLFWTLLFPIALSTFMYMAFGSIFEKDNIFHPVKMAVIENKTDDNFMQLIHSLSEDSDNKTFELVAVKDEQDAKNKLEDEKIQGYYVVDDKIKLVINSNKIDQTILESVLTQYEQISKTTHDAMKLNSDDMENVEEVIKTLTSNNDYFNKNKTSNGNQDIYTTYFYAVFAMACLFSSFSGVEKAISIRADTSAIGMRRNLLPNSKAMVIVCDFLAALIVEFSFLLISFIYMNCVLGIDFNTKYHAILLLLFVGCGCGVGIGTIIGSIPSLKAGTKNGIATIVAMGFSVMSDLVANGIKDTIEHTCPIINRINPAALIVDSFYALNVYDTYDRFLQNIAILSVMTVSLLLISFLIVRRERYASL